ncbi:hypothetical protein [Streptomyces mirabilis]|uniref:hypothetical protein n=1 Tax=Streptomyces mirabilis TaxID=68239 RepID=UPI00324BF24B
MRSPISCATTPPERTDPADEQEEAVVPLSLNEIRPMYDRIVLAPARAARTWLALHWNRWRRRHQTQARKSHYRQREHSQ